MRTFVWRTLAAVGLAVCTTVPLCACAPASGDVSPAPGPSLAVTEPSPAITPEPVSDAVGPGPAAVPEPSPGADESDGEMKVHAAGEAAWTFDSETDVLTFEGDGSLSETEAETADRLDYSWTGLADKVTAIVIGEGVTRVPNCAFYGFAKVTSVSLPSTLDSIGMSAFLECAFEEIYLPEGLTSIGGAAFSHCGQLRWAEIPGGVEVLEGAVFGECGSLQDITLREGVRELKEACLWCCEGINSIVFPASVTSIEELYAENLRVAVFKGDPPALPVNTVTGEYMLGYLPLMIYYPEGNEKWNELAAQYPHENITWIEGGPEDGA